MNSDLEERLLAAAAVGGPAALDRVVQAWEQQTGSRSGLTDALMLLEAEGKLTLDAARDGERVQVFGIAAVTVPPAEPESSSVDLILDLDPRRVFVVHGRNESLRRDLFGLLRALDLHPVEWSELVRDFGSGAPYIGELLDHAFATAQAVVVLMSPDEHVELASEFADGSTDAGHQARPNVIFEAGMALGRNPNRTVIVEVGRVRPFSDLAGRHVVRLHDRPPHKDVKGRQDLGMRLQAIGCPAQLGGSDWHTFGEFLTGPT